MLTLINTTPDLLPFLTTELLENEVGVILDSSIPNSHFTAINIDEYYHKNSHPTPEIADILIVIQNKPPIGSFALYIVEMKNISSSKGFKTNNIYNKFKTAIEDFIHGRYPNIFLNTEKEVTQFQLYFISDAYRLKKRGFSDQQIRSFLDDTKIGTLQSMPPFIYRNFKAHIEYKLPNPLIAWA